MEMEYEAYRYAADGHAGEQGDGEVIARGSRWECQCAIAARMEPSTYMLERLWRGTGSDVEAYHEGMWEGCGGWAIRPVAE